MTGLSMSLDKPTLGFIGLGVMGFSMAGHLAKAGFKVIVFNRSEKKSDFWLQHFNGSKAITPKQLAQQCDVVFSCVGNDDDVKQVLIGDEGAIHGLKEGGIIVDHTTTSAEVARELAAQFEKEQVEFLDAPVSGGQAGAENGRLTVMCGGNRATFDRVVELINCYAIAVEYMGENGSGQLTKMVNQICIAGLVQGLSEGIHFAKQAKLNVADVVRVISKGAAQSWQMDNRWQTMLADEYNHGFAVDWMRKDLRYVLEEADRNQSMLPITKIVDQYYAEVQTMGGNRWDTSSLLAVLEKKQQEQS